MDDPAPEEIKRLAKDAYAAIGRTEMVRGDWIKPGAAVIDVGINRIEDDSGQAIGCFVRDSHTLNHSPAQAGRPAAQ